MAKILIVDDDEDMIALSARWLEKAGYEVIKATSGKEALELLNTDNIDLILLDYAMPDMEGHEVLRAIRQNEKTSSTPVIIRTGMDDTEIESQLSGLNPQLILPKSEGKAALLQAVSNVLSL